MTAPISTQSTSRVPLAISLFGPMLVVVKGCQMPPPRSRKSLWLLALLTLRHDRPVEREWLAGTLYPDMSQGQALANLRRILSELRTSLENQGWRLQSPSRHTLLLDLVDADVDVAAFDAAIACRKPASLERAVALYRGPLLEGCTEEWIGQERVARERDFLHALQKLADSAISAGDYSTAIGHYQRAVRHDPLWDTAQRGLMEALARAGDANAALQVYRDFVEQLKSDPKAVPDERTSALYLRLRAEARQRSEAGLRIGIHAAASAPAAQPAVAPDFIGCLPHPLTDLLGREDERLEVAARLRRSRLVTLTGVGGIGKTRLAIKVAEDMVREHEDGVWLVALEALNGGEQIVHQAASVLGLKEEPGRLLLQSLTDHLRAKRLLLVLDNCEHLLEASAQVAVHLLQECPGIRILATSREALGITGETAWNVPSLAVPDPMHLPQGQATLLRVLMDYEGVRMFVERAQAAQKSFHLTASNALTVAELCSRLEGIPLAIELAAAWVKALTVGQILSRLYDHLGLLLAGSRAAGPRQQALRAALDWSYKLLSRHEQTLLQRLSVFASGWTLAAAEQVCASAGTEIFEVADLLTSLVDKSLVMFEERDSECGGRYRLLEIVRQYAAAKLQESAETELIRAKHRVWLIDLAEEAEPQLKGEEQKTWLARLELERDNLRATLEWDGDGPEGAASRLRLVGAYGRYWYIRGNYHEGRQYLEQALERDKARTKTTERAKALNGAGTLAYRQGEFHTAQALFEESLTIRLETGDRQGYANTLGNQGMVAQGLGDFPAARTLFEESLRIQRELGNQYGIAVMLNNLGNIAQAQHFYPAARALYEESLQIQTKLEDKYGIAWSLNSLGNVALDQDDNVSAEALHKESLALFQELGDRRGIAWSLYKLGSVARRLGDYSNAQTLYDESLRVFREIGERHGAAWSVYQLGYVAHLAADPGLARALYDEARQNFIQIGDRLGIAWSAEKLGNLAYEQGDMTLSGTRYSESLDIFCELTDKEGAANNLIGIAAMMLVQGGHENAVRLLGAAEALRETTSSLHKPAERKRFAQQVAQARSSLGETAFATAWETGRSLTLAQATEQALLCLKLH